MQTGVGGLNLAQVVGSLGACALVLGGFWGLVWLKKRGREERKERPPQREKLLRPAGYSAMCRVEALSEKWMSEAAQAIGARMFFGLTAGTFYPLLVGLALGRVTVRQVWNAPRLDVIIVAALVGITALLWAVRAFQLVWRLEDELRNWRFGLRGEQAVAESLANWGCSGGRIRGFPPAVNRSIQRNATFVTKELAYALLPYDYPERTCRS